MPKLQINYGNAVVYKLCCKDVNITNIYVGSTTNFKNRKCAHKSTCNNETDKNYYVTVYVFIRENGGWENWDMIEIEKVDCNDANELHTRERFYLELLKADLNKQIPTRTHNQYREENRGEIRIKGKQHYEANKSKIKEYVAINKEKIKTRMKKYAEINKDKFKEYRELNAEKIKARESKIIVCECGRSCSHKQFKTHLKSKKHQEFESSKQKL